MAYLEYIDALDTYATAAASRWESCVPGTDDLLDPSVPCHPHASEYQDTRYVFQGERNDMELIASEEALLLATAIGQALPNSNTGLTGDAVDGDPVPERFRFLYGMLLEIAACDTSPNPREDCARLREYVQSETGLANLVDILRETDGSGSEASMPPPGGLTDLLRQRISNESDASTAPG